MPQVYLQTARLDFHLEEPAEVLVRIGGMPPDIQKEFSPIWLEKVKALTAPDPWLQGFALVDRESGMSIGGCGFKGPPDAEGMIEIAYGIDEPHQGKGYATEAASGLVQLAYTNAAVKSIRAHTLPQNGASARVLTKLGFVHLGEVIDPEDGLVWRWERLAQTD